MHKTTIRNTETRTHTHIIQVSYSVMNEEINDVTHVATPYQWVTSFISSFITHWIIHLLLTGPSTHVLGSWKAFFRRTPLLLTHTRMNSFMYHILSLIHSFITHWIIPSRIRFVEGYVLGSWNAFFRRTPLLLTHTHIYSCMYHTSSFIHSFITLWIY